MLQGHFHRSAGRTTAVGTVVLLALAAPPRPSAAQSCPPLELNHFTPGDGHVGWSVAVDGDFAIAGAGTDQSAWILARDARGNWSIATKIQSPAQIGAFGRAAAISGDTAVVGGAVDSGPSAFEGRAFVFQRDAGGLGAWGDVAELLLTSAPAGLQVAFAVAIDGDTAVVTAAGDHLAPATAGPGVALVFDRNFGGPDAWGPRATLQPPRQGVNSDRFGSAVALSGDTVVVGEDHRHGNGLGKAYVYARDAGGPDQWGLVAELAASDGADGDEFGGALALDGDRLVVGGRNGDFGDILYAGGAYIFERHLGGPDAWGELIRLAPPAIDLGDDFGSSVDIDGDQVIVGAQWDTVGGSAHVFMRDFPAPGAWGHFLKLRGSSAGDSAIFGAAVAIQGDRAFVGAHQEAPSSNGAVYVFAVDGPDCNLNGVPDACDILDGSPDDDGDGVPDLCSADCDRDGVLDVLQIVIDAFLDCDVSGVLDSCEIAGGLLSDFNADGFPDVCDPLDCNGNGTPDVIDIGKGGAADCNGNFMLDSCETSVGLAWDDGIPEVALGSSQGIPVMWANPFDAGTGAVIDSVRFGIFDDGVIAAGDPVSVFLWDDPDDDGQPDDAVLLRSGAGTIQSLTVFDARPARFNEVAVEPIAISGGFFAGVLTTTAQFPVLASGVPEPWHRSWGLVGFDDPDAIQMAPQITFGVVLVRAGEIDCDANGAPDSCDIAGGTLGDTDGDGIPDGCDCPADVDGDNSTGITDLLALLAAWGTTTPTGGPPDINHDGIVDVRDLDALLQGWGDCR